MNLKEVLTTQQFHCPRCGKPVTNAGSSPNGGELFVGEEFPQGTEVYDAPISEFKCTDPSCKTTFFL